MDTTTTYTSGIPKNYQFDSVESKWYQAWLQAKCFIPKKEIGSQSFTIVIPPPNVTGVLTMGHVLNNTLQDILIRRARQSGKTALWIPGTDHAGIATQTRVEKVLAQENTTRQAIGREAFVQRTIEWRDNHGNIICDQLKRLGCSCDWDQYVHTLDEDYSNAVLTVFIELYDRGYIYRGQRMINWCPGSQTALSDEEVFMTEVNGFLYQVRYEMIEHPGTFIEISTTRPETIMADVAIAVHPDDARYQQLIGKQCRNPITGESIPIIADTAVLPDFGTGALKITPAHDPLDFQIGKRHSLPFVDIMNPDGTLNEKAGEVFKGMDRFKARAHVAACLQEKELLVKKTPYIHEVGFSERAQIPIEPRISEQWFLKYPKVEEAKKALTEGHIQFFPDRWTKTYLYWLNNIQDWCISRQLWWGHRIPVWYRKGTDRTDSKNWYIALNAPSDLENWEQDEDVLDTWFSSWLWAFSTLGWPDKKSMEAHDFEYYYPTASLVTGPDILFFWVARMIIAGLEFIGEAKPALTSAEIQKRIPFKAVYFTGIIRDKQGRKMSKSLGNSPDPITLIERYGADGLRFGIISIAAQGQDVLFDEEQIEYGRNFCTKLWNASRYRQLSGPIFDNYTLEAILKRIDPLCMDDDDHAVLIRLLETIDQVENHLNTYTFHLATQVLYTFFWSDFCDWYLEVCKVRQLADTAKITLLSIQDLIIRQLLLLLHPFIPFITEELWHLLGYGQSETFIQDTISADKQSLDLQFQANGLKLNAERLQLALDLRETVSAIRSLKSNFQVANKRDSILYYKTELAQAAYIEAYKNKLLKMTGSIRLEPLSTGSDLPVTLTALGSFYLDSAQSIDKEAEQNRLEKELAKLKGFITATQNRLNSPKFIESAPESIIEGARKQLNENESKYNKLMQALKDL
jgi:valyl-tRNA synthetase